MSGLLWYTVDERIKKLREIGLIDYIAIRLETQRDDHILQEDLEDDPFTKVMRKSLVKGIPFSLRIPGVTIFCYTRLIEKMLLQNWPLIAKWLMMDTSLATTKTR